MRREEYEELCALDGEEYEDREEWLDTDEWNWTYERDRYLDAVAERLV